MHPVLLFGDEEYPRIRDKLLTVGCEKYYPHF